jgi:hypothetical protein
MLKYVLKRQNIKFLSQLELGVERPVEPDRNYVYGGRSFYFFDFDDNVAFLPTPMVIFHKETNKAVEVSTAEWSVHHSQVGKSGPYKDYKIDYNDAVGSFKRFRDDTLNFFQKYVMGKRQPFVEDVIRALRQPDLNWKGPSWDCFYHAVYNQRPISIITARGHSRQTIIEGIQLLVDQGFLPHKPNYLEIYPVNHPSVRRELGDIKLDMTVPELKKAAIRASVEKALMHYGAKAPHRFGMSDDDKKNLALIFDEMKALKKDYPDMSFFVINTSGSTYVKKEVQIKEDNDMHSSPALNKPKQLSLFDVQTSPNL